MGHDVAHRAVAEVEHRAQHRLLGRHRLVGLALAVHLDGAAQHVGMLVDLGPAVDMHADHPQEEARDPGDGARHRSQDRQGHHDRRRQDQRHPVGAQQRPGLGHHFGEDHDHDADDDRGVDDAGGAEDRGQHRRGERGREDVDHAVAQQHGAHRLVLAVEQAVDQDGALVALLGEAMHARPRGAGDRRFGRRHVGAQHQAEHDQRAGDLERQIEMEVGFHAASGGDGVVEQAAQAPSRRPRDSRRPCRCRAPG